MSTQGTKDRLELLQGTLDLLILRTLIYGSQHGQGIARSIQRQSEEVFFVDHGSLYLALQRLEERVWISAEWGVSSASSLIATGPSAVKGGGFLSNAWRSARLRSCARMDRVRPSPSAACAAIVHGPAGPVAERAACALEPE